VLEPQAFQQLLSFERYIGQIERGEKNISFGNGDLVELLRIATTFVIDSNR